MLASRITSKKTPRSISLDAGENANSSLGQAKARRTSYMGFGGISGNSRSSYMSLAPRTATGLGDSGNLSYQQLPNDSRSNTQELTDASADTKGASPAPEEIDRLDFYMPAFVPRWLWEVHSMKFGLMVGLIVLFNAVCVGLETDLGAEHFNFAEHFFCDFFLLEFCLRVRADGLLTYWSDPANVFDTFLVCTGATELYINPLINHYGGGHSSGMNMGVLRVMRLLRMLRVLRVLRLFHLVHMMTVILQAFVSAFTSVVSIGTLLLVLIYILAVLLTQVVGHNAANWGDKEELVHGWFGSVGVSMRTLFIIMTLVDWDHIAITLCEVYPAMVVFPCFCLYIIIASYTMVSLVTAVISESLISVQRDDAMIKEAEIELSRGNLAIRIKSILMQFDDDGSGTIDRDEVKAVFERQPEIRTNLAALDIHTDLDELLNCIDRLSPDAKATSDGVAIDEVVSLLINLSGSAKASSVFDVKHKVLGVENKLIVVERQLNGINSEMALMQGSNLQIQEMLKQLLADPHNASSSSAKGQEGQGEGLQPRTATR